MDVQAGTSGGDAESSAFATVVDELGARVRITDVLYREARGIDRNDAECRASAYHADATIDAGPGPRPVRELLATRTLQHEHTVHTAHVVTNVLIEFVSAVAAFVESYVVACEWEGPGYDFSWRGIPDAGPAGARIQSWCRYLDIFECRSGQWLIRERAVVFGDTVHQSLDRAPALPERFLRQGHGPDDPLRRYRERAHQIARAG